MIKKENLIVLYPEAFPLTGPLRNAFTERLYNLFCGDGDIFSSYRNRTMFWRDGTWYLREDTLPEKLFKIRDEMQKYIEYPPVIPRVPNEFHDDSEFILDIFTPEELFAWKGLKYTPIRDLPHDVRDAGIDMASRVLGISLQYIDTDASEKLDWTSASDTPLIDDDTPTIDGNITPIASSLCPVSSPKRISMLAKNWSAGDRKLLTGTIRHHIEVAVLGAFIIGLVFGFLIDTTNRYAPAIGQTVPQAESLHPLKQTPSIRVYQKGVLRQDHGAAQFPVAPSQS